jgi:hypothetical protein
MFAPRSSHFFAPGNVADEQATVLRKAFGNALPAQDLEVTGTTLSEKKMFCHFFVKKI